MILDLIRLSALRRRYYNEKFEDYTLDQFLGRDFFRKIKAYVTYNVFKQKDNNDILEFAHFRTQLCKNIYENLEEISKRMEELI